MFFDHISKFIAFYQSEQIRFQTFVCIQNGLFYLFVDEQSKILLQPNRYPSKCSSTASPIRPACLFVGQAAAGKDDGTIFYHPPVRRLCAWYIINYFYSECNREKKKIRNSKW